MKLLFSFQTLLKAVDSFKRPIIDTCIKTVVLSWPTFGHNMQYFVSPNPIKDRHCKTNSVMYFMLGSRFFFEGAGVFRWISVIASGRGGIKTYFWSFYIVNLRNLKFSGGTLPLIRACIYFNYFNTGLIENDYCISVSKLLSFIHNILTKTAMKTSIRIWKLSTKVLFFFLAEYIS